MNLRIEPCLLHGAAAAPPSKSCAHRSLLCAALTPGRSTVSGISESEDMQATLDCLSALGRRWERRGDRVTVSDARSPALDHAVFPCRESGSTLRFLLPVALALGGSAVFTGSERLMERGISVYEDLFAEQGVTVRRTPVSLAVEGRLKSGKLTVPGGVSSQFVSGLLFALPLLKGESVLTVLPPVESRPYIRLTLEALRSSGVVIGEAAENRFHIPGNQAYRASEVMVEGDWSNGAVLFALRALGHDLRVTGLNDRSAQGDRVITAFLHRLAEPEPALHLADCPDLAPTLFSVAAAKHGGVFTGTRRLRLKESDRASVMAEELRKFGVRVELREDRVTVFPGSLHRPAEPLSGHGDHRIVMALTLLCTLTGGEIVGAEAVQKSWPDFFPTLEKLGLMLTRLP